jgi:hypothetical protein
MIQGTKVTSNFWVAVVYGNDIRVLSQPLWIDGGLRGGCLIRDQRMPLFQNGEFAWQR